MYASFLILFISYGDGNIGPYYYRVRHKDITLILNHDDNSDFEVSQPANMTVMELNHTLHLENANQVSIYCHFPFYMIFLFRISSFYLLDHLES